MSEGPWVNDGAGVTVIEYSSQFDLGAKTERFKAQAFFAELALEVVKPHYGGPAREFTQSILLRAIERGLYTPEKP